MLICNSTVCLQTYYCVPTINTEPVASQWQGVSKAISPSRCQPTPHQSSTITHTTTWGVQTSTLGLSTNKPIFVFISNSSKVSHCVELFALLLLYLPIRWASVTAHVPLVYTQPFQWNVWNLPHCDLILLLILHQINHSQPSVAAACIGQSSWPVIEVSKFQSVGKSWKSGTMYRTTECSLTEEQWTASGSDLPTSEIGVHCMNESQHVLCLSVTVRSYNQEMQLACIHSRNYLAATRAAHHILTRWPSYLVVADWLLWLAQQVCDWCQAHCLHLTT